MILSESTLRVLSSAEALTGWRAGLVAAAVLLVVELARRVVPSLPATSGVLVALAGAVGLDASGRGSLALTLVVAVLAIGGVGMALTAAPRWSRAAALVPGVVLLVIVHQPVIGWMAWLLPAVVLVVGTTAPMVDPRDLDHHVVSGAAASLLGVATVAIFFAVPDTEHVVVVLTATLPVIAVAWLTGARLGGGAAGALTVLGVAIAADGAARPWTIAAALGCLGLLLVQPLARTGTTGTVLDVLARRRLGVLGLAAVQLGVGFVCARILVQAGDTVVVAVRVVVLLGVVGLAAHGVARVTGRRATPRAPAPAPPPGSG